MKPTVGTMLVALSLIVPASHSARSSYDAERIWILPFTQSQPDPAVEHLQDALPALVAVAVSGSSGPHSVVEREKLDTVLSELSLSLEHLTSAAERLRVGKLLGATVMLTGSFALQGSQLHVTMRASDLETGVVASTADGVGHVGEPGALVTSLYRRLASNFGRRLPEPAASQIDAAPQSNLHFMKGLGHYHNARYSHSIAEFMLAAEDSRLAAVSGLWLAKAYLAQRQYSHACLELMRLKNGALTAVESRDVAASLRECERHVSGEDLRMIRELAARRDRTGK
jgi:hypothetical protein